MRTNEDGSSKNGCSDAHYCKDGKPDDSLKKNDGGDGDGGRDMLDVYTRTKGGHFVSWEGERDVPIDYWQFTLDEFGKDSHSWATSRWKFLMPIRAIWYDSDFYNEDTPFTKPLTGMGCLDNNCYDRSEINYFAQGEIWAAYGVTKDKGHDIVKFWKEAKCAWMCERNDLQEEYDMFDIGYRHYQELYPQPNHPTYRPR